MAMVPTGRWCLVTDPEFYTALPEELKHNNGLVTWSAPSRLTVGDIAILYETSPSKQFKWLFQARSDAIPEPLWGHMAWFEAIELEKGIGFSEVAADPMITANWPMIRARLVGSNHVVPEIAWERLIEIIDKRNPAISSLVHSWHKSAPTPIDRALEDFIPADDYSFTPLFQLERLMEDFVLAWFTSNNIARLPLPDDGLKIIGRQDRINPGMRTDLILVDQRGHEKQLLLLELKLWVRSNANISQAQGYCQMLQNLYPQWKVSCNLIAQGYSDPTLVRAKASGVTCWKVAEDGFGNCNIHVL
jgi:hypothetical protein